MTHDQSKPQINHYLWMKLRLWITLAGYAFEA